MLFNAADKALWRLVIPMIFPNITVPLLGLVDIAAIGHPDSPVYPDSVAAGVMATSLLFMLLLFLRMSTIGLTAQAWDVKDSLRLARALVQSLALTLGARVLIILFCLSLINLALHIAGDSEAVLEQARRFLEIRWLSAPALLANLVLFDWLLEVQYARAPVILLVVGNLLSIVLDPWLVMGLRMNVQGVVLTTVTAEYVTLIIDLMMAKRVLTLRGVSLVMLKNVWRGDLRRLLALNRDIMLRSLLLQLCFGVLTVYDARLDGNTVAVNAVLMTTLIFIAYALDGFICTVEAHSGQVYGTCDGSQLLEVWWTACRQPGMAAPAFALIYSLAGEYITALLASPPSLQQLVNRYLIWQTILSVVGVRCYLLGGMFIGATRGVEMRNSMAVAAAGSAVTLLSVLLPGNHGLWLAPTVSLVLRGLSLALIWHCHWRHGTQSSQSLPFITTIYEFPRLRAVYRGSSVARLSVTQAGKIVSALPTGMMVKNSE